MPDRTKLDQSPAALVLIDVINHFEFPDGPRLLRHALAMAPRLAKLKKRAIQAGIPAIYVNDNFGDWRSNAAKLVEYCLRTKAPGRSFVQQLEPAVEDYFVLKPMHSAFYHTPLDVLLQHLGVSSIILCGLATNSCIICTAHDANMRGYRILITPDCCAARTEREHDQAIDHLRSMTDAKIVRSSAIRLPALLQEKTSRVPAADIGS